MLLDLSNEYEQKKASAYFKKLVDAKSKIELKSIITNALYL